LRPFDLLDTAIADKDKGNSYLHVTGNFRRIRANWWRPACSKGWFNKILVDFESQWFNFSEPKIVKLTHQLNYGRKETENIVVRGRPQPGDGVEELPGTE
jgi:hypothetical protein